jgi:SAM-dependent methyltransferase
MAVQTLDSALGEVRMLLLDGDHLVRAVAAGRRRGQSPSVARAEFRPVVLKAGPRLQVVTSDGARPYTRNVAWGEDASAAVDALLGEPFGNWHVETTAATLQLRVTKKGDAQVHRSAQDHAIAPSLEHDRSRVRLIDPGDPLYDVVGGSGTKRRQVETFLRILATTLGHPGAASNGSEAAAQPLRVVDLGCGNAYLTFAAYRFLTQNGIAVELVGVDIRADQRQRNTEIAAQLGWSDRVRFVSGTIEDARVPFAADSGPADRVDVVLALHACDTATDEALARAVAWRARSVLAAPCCHHDIARQLRGRRSPSPYGLVTGQPILRERFADVLTDALRAALLRLHGYSVDVMEFVEAKHTPRNLLIRAHRTGISPTAERRQEYERLVGEWGVTPHLARLLG